jgi:hypothetical protein
MYGCIRLADIWNIPYYRADTKRLSIVLMGKDAFRRFGMFILKKTSMIWRAADAQGSFCEILSWPGSAIPRDRA